MSENKVPNVPNEEWITVKDAVKLTGYGNAHLRMNILKPGKVEHVRSTIPGTSIPRILINKTSLLEYMQKTGKARGGMISTYLTEEEVEMIMAQREANS